jgi:acetyl esterase/lipase
MHRFFARLAIGLTITLITITLMLTATGSSSPASADPGPVAPQVGLAYGPEPFQLLDLHLPDADQFPGRRPVLVFVHAGGWVRGDRSTLPEIVSAQVARGYALVTIDYRLATMESEGAPVASFPGAIWDVKRAIRFVKSNAETWGIDPRRVIIVGASAGGYLASFVGATRGVFEPPDLTVTSNRRKDSSVRAVVDLVGPTDLVTFQHTNHPWAAPLTAAFIGCAPPSEANPPTCPDDQLLNASVETWVDRTDPPIYLGYGGQDELVVPATQGEPLARLWLATHGGDPASTTYQVVGDAGHNLPADQTLQPFSEFLDRASSNGRGQV